MILARPFLRLRPSRHGAAALLPFEDRREPEPQRAFRVGQPPPAALLRGSTAALLGGPPTVRPPREAALRSARCFARRPARRALSAKPAVAGVEAPAPAPAPPREAPRARGEAPEAPEVAEAPAPAEKDASWLGTHWSHFVETMKQRRGRVELEGCVVALFAEHRTRVR